MIEGGPAQRISHTSLQYLPTLNPSPKKRQNKGWLASQEAHLHVTRELTKAKWHCLGHGGSWHIN